MSVELFILQVWWTLTVFSVYAIAVWLLSLWIGKPFDPAFARVYWLSVAWLIVNACVRA